MFFMFAKHSLLRFMYVIFLFIRKNKIVLYMPKGVGPSLPFEANLYPKLPSQDVFWKIIRLRISLTFIYDIVIEMELPFTTWVFFFILFFFHRSCKQSYDFTILSLFFFFWQNCIFDPLIYFQFWIWSPSNLIHKFDPYFVKSYHVGPPDTVLDNDG